MTGDSAVTGRLVDVLPSTLAALGVPGRPDALGLTQQLDGVDRIALLLVDGLGFHLLARAAPFAPTLAALRRGEQGDLRQLTCGFPSTTPTSLVSLGTGALPGAHGVVGFTVNVPGTDDVLTHVLWRDEPEPALWQPVPTLFAAAAAAGLDPVVVARPEFAGSGLTVSAYCGARFVGAARSEEVAAAMTAALASGSRLVYGYHPTVDTVAHLHGIASPDWERAVASADRLITRVASALPRDAALLVTADHGAIDVPDEERVDAGADARLAAGVRVFAGEPRVRYLHVQPGARDDVVAAWRDVLGGRATVVTREEAVDSGWFGPVPADHLARIGDVVVVCQGRTVVLASGHEPAAVAALVAFHGSTTPEETAIPLLVVRGR